MKKMRNMLLLLTPSTPRRLEGIALFARSRSWHLTIADNWNALSRWLKVKLCKAPLTTIRQPVKLLAETAVASLLQRIRNPGLAPRAILLDTQMVVRRST